MKGLRTVLTQTHVVAVLFSLIIIANGLTLTNARRPKSAGDIWVPISEDFGWPDPPAQYHTAVWTGTEMILTGEWLGTTVSKYNPTTDAWINDLITSTPPIDCPRKYHTAIWTGTEEIAWGGFGEHHATGAYRTFWDGVRFNPSSETWTTIAGGGDRCKHNVVWTGTEMIVWGGYEVALPNWYPRGDGSRYNPSTDTWSMLSSTNAPSTRVFSSAVWTGTEMIIWGGAFGGTHFTNGSRYDPSTDTWTQMSTTDAPIGRVRHTAIWTGTEMIIWGGDIGGYNRLGDGAKYNPSTDTWASISMENAPSNRSEHTAVWTGTEMIIWGGFGDSGSLGDGARYDPQTDTWTPLSNLNDLSPRLGPVAVWTGTEMIIWGGENILDGACWYPAAEAAEDLSSTVEEMDLSRRLEAYLVTKLTVAIISFENENLKVAENMLGDFYEKVQQEKGKGLTNEQADELTNKIMEIWVRTQRALWDSS